MVAAACSLIDRFHISSRTCTAHYRIHFKDCSSEISPIVVQIGFEKTSYTVGEGDKSVSVCANLIAGTITTPVSVTLVTLDTATAHGKFSE